MKKRILVEFAHPSNSNRFTLSVKDSEGSKITCNFDVRNDSMLFDILTAAAEKAESVNPDAVILSTQASEPNSSQETVREAGDQSSDSEGIFSSSTLEEVRDVIEGVMSDPQLASGVSSFLNLLRGASAKPKR